MVQFLSIIFFSWISSIFVGVFKSSRFLCHSVSNEGKSRATAKKFFAIVECKCSDTAFVSPPFYVVIKQFLSMKRQGYFSDYYHFICRPVICNNDSYLTFVCTAL